jgi:hypothetical protein
MTYTIDIYKFDFSTKRTVLFYSQDIYNFSYSTEINKPGGAKFSINVRNSKATTSNLKMYNKVIIKRNGVGVFIGYIENIQATLNVVDVICIGMLGFFKRRLFSGTFNTAGGDTAQDAFYEVLDSMNLVNDTGITQGTTDISKNINELKFVRSTVYKTFDQIASFADGEFRVNTDKTIDFLDRLGEDKSATISLQYNINQINSANLRQFDVAVQGKDTVNDVIGIRNGGATGNKSDATSISEFGMLSKTINFSDINNATDLDTEMENYIEKRKIEFYSPKVVLDERKIDVNTLNLGDTVQVNLNNGFMSLALNERIVKKEVNVSDNATEEVKISLIAETGNLLPSSFIEDIITLGNRVASLESGL